MFSFATRPIVVAVDEFPVSCLAFDAAVSLAKSLSAKLTIVRVLNPYGSMTVQPYPMAGSIAGVGIADIDAMTRQQYEKVWTAYVERYELLPKQKIDEAIAAVFCHACVPYRFFSRGDSPSLGDL